VRALVQRVRHARVDVEVTGYHAGIGDGLLVLLGVEIGDTESEASWIAKKLVQLRIFRDEDGRMNRSVEDIDGALLIVSQFTLAGDCTKGNRPSFVRAASPAKGERLYGFVVDAVREAGRPVETGQFGADMRIHLLNDGPVTLMIEKPPATP